MNNPSLDMFDLPGNGSTIEGDAYQAYLRKQAEDAAAPQNPGIQNGLPPQPISPLGSAMGPTSVQPVKLQGQLPGIPTVPQSLSPQTQALLQTQAPQNAFTNAGQGLANFKAALSKPSQPLIDPPQPPPRPSTYDRLGVNPKAQDASTQRGLADMLKKFGINLNGLGQGVSHALDGIGQGINTVGTGIGDGITGALNGLFHGQ